MSRKTRNSRKKAPSTGLVAQARQQVNNKARESHEKQMAAPRRPSMKQQQQMAAPRQPPAKQQQRRAALLDKVHRDRTRRAEAIRLAQALSGEYGVTPEGYIVPMDSSNG